MFSTLACFEGGDKGRCFFVGDISTSASVPPQLHGLLTYQLVMCASMAHMATTGSRDQCLISERERERRLLRLRMAAGAQTTQFQHGEVVTRNNDLRQNDEGYPKGWS